jgi:phosphatidylserine/phosphatidylglycerophosphate/cardiolipin synthase-like enzyme
VHIARASIVTAVGFTAVLGLIDLLRPVAAAPAPAARLSAGVRDVVINEVAWGGTAADANDEWIELKNNTASPVDLTGWSLRSGDGSPNIALSGAIPPDGYFLLERTDDTTVSDIPADQIYAGGLANTGETLTLADALSNVVDTANVNGGSWPAGSGSPGFYSMERIDSTAPDTDANWASNNGATRNGLDANSNPINGTPKQPNSVMGTLPAPALPGSVLLSAVHFDAYANGDEGFRLTSVHTQAIPLTNWFATDGEGTLNLTGTLAAGQSIWIAKRAVTFTQQFGFKPDYEYEADTDSLVPNLTGSVPLFGDNDELAIRQGASNWIDAVVWGAGQVTATGWLTGWIGPGVQRYSNNSIAAFGQILYRKLDETTGAIVADTHTALDWANDSTDPISGRKTMYPGWDLEAFWEPARVAAGARLTVAIAPDNAYRVISDLLGSARQSVKIEMHTFEHPALAGVLTRTIQDYGVSVTVLLEGGPVGGIEDQELWICQQIEAAGGDCWFMITDSSADIRDRYDHLHAKLIVVDDRVAAIGSENLSLNSLPTDDFSDGTIGRRGVYLVTDAPGVVTRALQIWAADFDPANHRDIHLWSAGDPKYGAPPLGFTPVYTSGGSGYTIRYPEPLGLSAPLTFELLTAPESSLRARDALLGLIAQAGPGDSIDAEQLEERPHWRNSSSNPVDDPNLRLQALIDAASRGARVRLLLDGYFDDPSSPVSNAATHAYVESLRAISPVLASHLEVRLGNRTLLGVHNKMLLIALGGRKIVHAGSLNGSEASHKVNREIALQVESGAAYEYLRAMFEHDWAFRPRVYLPLALRNYMPPANHLLVSKVFYLGTPGVDEWVQIYNPTAITMSLSGFKIGDEETRGGGGFGFDGMWEFPPVATIAPGQKINIAGTFAGFYARFGYDPNFAFFDGVAGVSRMTPYLAWTSAATLTLANVGDEVLLLGPGDQLIDGVAWGTGGLPGHASCPAIAPPPYASIERMPIWQDTDSCPADFVTNPSPLP